MNARVSQLNGDNAAYFDRKPELLVLEGYRRWMAGYETGSVTPWEMTWTLYEATLGAERGRRAMAELGHFVRTLRRCASCPLLSFPFGAHHVCRDECLTLGLVAGLQHGDQPASDTCLAAMACPLRQAEVGAAARSFAGTLGDLDQVLLPIPLHAIEDVLARAWAQARARSDSATVH